MVCELPRGSYPWLTFYTRTTICCVVSKHHRMGLWKINSGDSSTFGAFPIILCLVVPMCTVQAQAIFLGHVTIVNSFSSPTSITCYSYLMSRQTYTAVHLEVYNIAFDTADGHQFWDCQVYNRGWGMLGVFRLYGDASHGGRELYDCENCIWKVDQSGLYIYIDAVWRFKYRWPRIRIQH